MTIETRRIWWKVAEHGCKNLISTAVWWFIVRRNGLIGQGCGILIAILWGFWLVYLITAVINTWLDRGGTE